MAKLRYTDRFKRDYRQGVGRGCDPEKLKALLELLRLDAPLPLDNRDGPVKGTSVRACRVEPGWTLYYRVREGTVTLLRVKYVRRERPTGAPPAGLWLRTLPRSPVKTGVTLLLLAAASFLFLYNLSGYLMQREASRQAEESFHGLLTAEKSPVARLLDTHLFNAFLLTDPTAPAKSFFSYASVHHEALTAEEVDALAALPGVDEVDRRYMTAGISEKYARLDSYREFFNNCDRCILEGTVLWGNTDEVWYRASLISKFSAEYSDVRNYGLGDVKLLAGDPALLEAHLKGNGGRVKLQLKALRDDLIAEDGTHFGTQYYCDNYDLSLEDLKGLVPGRRYVFVLRVDPFNVPYPAYNMGDDTRVGWWPYITDVTDLPKDWLEGEEFAPLRELIQVTDDDLHTFDVVYTSDMATIRRVDQELLLPSRGRFLGPEDAGKPVCVVSETFLTKYGLDLGDEITLKLGNVLCEQYVPVGAVAATQGRHATELEERTFTVVGAFRDVFERSWQDRELYWSYGENTVFVPSEFLPTACDTENHLFRPAEVSFMVNDAWNLLRFEEEAIPQVEAMGLRYLFADGGWPSVAEKLAETRKLTLLKLLVFSAAALLAAGLTLYLFLHRRRREYAILRALGCPRRGAAKALLLPLLTLSAFSVLLGAAGAYLRSGELADRSLREFEEAGIGAVAAVRPGWYLWGALGLLCLLGLTSALYLRILGRRSPLQLLQEGVRPRGTKEAAEAALLQAAPAAPPAAEGLDPLPGALSGRRPAPGFLLRYVFRHVRRAGARTLLAILLAALLAGAVGQLTVLKDRYGEATAEAAVSVHYYNGLSYTKAQLVADSGFVTDPVWQKVFKDAELEFNATQVWFLNRLEGFVFDPVTWLEGWDEEKAMEESSRVCILTAPDMERLGVELGDKVRVNEGGCIGILISGTHANPKTWEEMVALRDAYRASYTVIGRVETEEEASVVYAPAAAFPYYSCFGYTLYFDEASYRLGSYYEAEEFRRYSDRLMLTIQDPPEFRMDTADADRIYRIYRLIETLYPLTVGAALLLGALLPVLMILQEQKEAAILRALGWSKKLTLRRLTLEQAALCLAGLLLALGILFAANGQSFLGVIPVLYMLAHFALCVASGAAVSASILRGSPMRLLQTKE